MVAVVCKGDDPISDFFNPIDVNELSGEPELLKKRDFDGEERPLLGGGLMCTGMEDGNTSDDFEKLLFGIL